MCPDGTPGDLGMFIVQIESIQISQPCDIVNVALILWLVNDFTINSYIWSIYVYSFVEVSTLPFYSMTLNSIWV